VCSYHVSAFIHGNQFIVIAGLCWAVHLPEACILERGNLDSFGYVERNMSLI
jgi:hypothetical protein